MYLIYPQNSPVREYPMQIVCLHGHPALAASV